jgi:hypothetical protein
MMTNIRRTSNRRGAAALIVAGALIVIGHALSVDMGSSGHRYVSDLAANRPLHVAGGLITAGAALLLSVGLFTTARHLGDDGRRFARVSAIAAAVGAAGMAMGLAMVAMVMGALTGKDTQLAVRAYDILNHAALASLPFLLAYLFTVGVIALAIWLLVAGDNKERWIGALLLIGTMIDFVTPSGGVVTAALHIPQATAFALLGVSLMGRSELTYRSVTRGITPVEAQPTALASS